MVDEYDPFRTDSGFKDDFDGEVVEAWFSTDPAYNAGRTLLYFCKVQADDGELVENRYGTGTGWNSYDGGITAENEKDTGDRPKAFQNGTAYAEFFSAAMEAGAEVELRRRSRDELGNQGPRNANLLRGLRFHWEVKTEEMTVKDRETQETKKITTNRTLPTKFLGVAGDAGTGRVAGQVASPAPSVPGGSTGGSPTSLSGVSQPQTAPSSSTSTEGVVPVQGSVQQPGPIAEPGTIQQPAEAPAASSPDFSYWADIPADLQLSIKTAAISSTYPEWVDAVLALPGAVAHGTLIQALGDENLYNALRTS